MVGYLSHVIKAETSRKHDEKGGDTHEVHERTVFVTKRIQQEPHVNEFNNVP
jgi:hypothetical protein